MTDTHERRALFVRHLPPMLAAALVIAGLSAAAQQGQAEATDPPAAASDETAPTATETAEPEPGPDIAPVNELIQNKDYAGAAEALAALREEFPDDPRLLAMHGEVLVALGRLDDAIPVLRKAIETDPEAPRLHFQLGTALAGTGADDEALEAFGRELQLNDAPMVQYMTRLNRSLLFQRREEYGRAAGEFEAVLELEPDRVQVYGDLIAVYLEAGMLDEARSALQRASEAGWTSAEHQESLAGRLYEAERWAEAAEAFRRALELDPDLEEARKGLAAASERAGGRAGG